MWILQCTCPISGKNISVIILFPCVLLAKRRASFEVFIEKKPIFDSIELD